MRRSIAPVARGGRGMAPSTQGQLQVLELLGEGTFGKASPKP